MLKKLLLGLVGVLLLAAIGLYFYIKSNADKIYDWPNPDLKTTKDSAVIAGARPCALQLMSYLEL